MTKSIIAVCVGAPLLALGFGAAPAAWAAPGGPHGASVSVNGDPKHQGDGEAESEASTGRAPNVAVAVKGSFAQAATGSGNHAVAINRSNAEAELGDGNHAVAVNGSNARANTGDNNRATAINNSGGNLGVTAGGGDNNSATAINNSLAVATTGDNNTALATNFGCAVATGGGATDRQHGSGCGS